MIQKNSDIHFLFNKVTKKAIKCARQAGRGGAKEAMDVIIDGLENQTLNNTEDLL